MATIYKLPASVVAQIAAGEVIERAAYAVKELVDNALDAGADYIRVDIEKSGLRRIAVTDNGAGMDREDLLVCFLPHTTSKLSADGLHAVRTLGFRGEALSSIAAVGRLSVRSRTAADSVGYEVQVSEDGGRRAEQVGMPVGTAVIVEGLFDDVPARKKYISNTVSEVHKIIEVLTSLILANPRVRFFVTHNGKNVIDAPGNQTLAERVKQLYGEQVYKSLIPLEADAPHIALSGYITGPQSAMGTQRAGHIFVNGRAVKDRRIAAIVREGYGTLLPPRSYPVFFFTLAAPHDTVDVNVHPRKEEVHFMHAELVYDLVRSAVPETLARHNLTFYDTRWKRSKRHLYGSVVEDAGLRAGGTDTYAAAVLKHDVVPENRQHVRVRSETATQLHDTYIVVESDQGMMVIDQHAAHERVLYEQYVAAYRKHLASSPQHVLERPVMLTLSPSLMQILEDNKDLFVSSGFDIDHFGGTSYAVKTVPELLRDRDAGELVREMLVDMAENNRVKDIDEKSLRMLAYLACRSAIKAGEKLTKSRMVSLIKELMDSPNNATCPHGRPTMIETDIRMLHKSFKRL